VDWRRLLGLAVVLFTLGAANAQAHEVRPGYLELRALDAGAWDVLFKVPAKGDRRLGMYVRLPDGCEATDPRSRIVGRAHVERWRVTCADGLIGQEIAVDGLAATRTDVLSRVKHADGSTQTVRLTSGEPAFTVANAPSQREVATTYLVLGVEHILLGIDHLLFVLALLLLVKGVKRVIGTITAFTVAHSLTLAAASLGFVYVPGPPVEAIVALSIVFVAAEIVRGQQGRPGLSAKAPWLIAFTFGLLHGLGFAGALREVGLPEQAIPLSLLFFNVGVELGQLLFIAAVASLGTLARWLPIPAPPHRRLLLPYGIGCIATFWVLERIAGF
jgi:hydrogenase/urease accessory protein HupE